MKTILFDSNNLQIKDLGDLPDVPIVGDIITIAKDDKYTSMWLVVQRNLCIDPDCAKAVWSLTVIQKNVILNPNTIKA